MRHPFERRRRTHVRLACQILHIERSADGMLVDLVALEPAEWNGRRAEAGTPFTVAFATRETEGRPELDAMMRVWERACAVVDIVIEEEPDGLRYEFIAGHHHLAIAVESPQPPDAP